MGAGYSTLPTTDENDAFAEQAKKEIKATTRRCKSAPTNCAHNTSNVRPALHTDNINALAAVRVGLVISGSTDKKIIVHNTDTGELVNYWSGHEKAVTKVIYKHINNNHIVLSGSRDSTVHLWRFNVPHPLQIYRAHTMSISGLALINDTQFVSGGRDATLRLWDLEATKPISATTINRNLVTHIEKLPNHDSLFVQTSEDRTLRCWDARTLSVVYQSQHRHQILWHCNVAADEPNYCLTSSGGTRNEGCEVTLWDLRKQCAVRDYRAHEASARAALFLPAQLTSRRLILTISNDHFARIYNQDDGQCLWSESISTTSDLNAAVAFADGTIVVGGDNALLCGLKLHSKAGRPLLVSHFIQSLATNEHRATAAAAANTAANGNGTHV